MGTRISDLTAIAEAVATNDLLALVNVSESSDKTKKVTVSQLLAALGTLGVSSGGTGRTSLTAYNVLIGNGTSAIAFAAPGTSGYPLLSQGASANPAFAQVAEDGQTLSDVTTLNASTTKHGYLRKLSGSASDVLRGDGTWGSTGPVPTGAPTLSLASGSSQITITITKGTGSTNTYIYRGTSSGVTNANGTLIYNSSGTSYTNTGLTNGTRYYYVAYGENNGAFGPVSSEVSGVPGFYLKDTFTDANGVSAASHLMDVGPTGPNTAGWTVNRTGTWSISSNRMTYSGSDGQIIADSSNSNCTISSTVNPGTDNTFGIGIYFRATDGNNCWLMDIVQDASTGLKLFKVSSGTFTQISSAGLSTFSNNTDYTATVTLSGSSISCTVNSVTVSTTDSYLSTNTKHGLKTGSSQHKFDDFQVTP